MAENNGNFMTSAEEAAAVIRGKAQAEWSRWSTADLEEGKRLESKLFARLHECDMRENGEELYDGGEGKTKEKASKRQRKRAERAAEDERDKF